MGPIMEMAVEWDFCSSQWLVEISVVAGAMTHKNKSKKGKIRNKLLDRLFQEVR
jgi:hypothetical protein